MCQGGEKGCPNPAEYGWKLCEVCLVKAADELDSMYGDAAREEERNNRAAVEEMMPVARQALRLMHPEIPEPARAEVERLALVYVQQENESIEEARRERL